LIFFSHGYSLSHTDLFHTDLKDFKDGYAALQLHGDAMVTPTCAPSRDSGKIFKIFKIRVKKIRVKNKIKSV
jgi:hypothetical protein